MIKISTELFFISLLEKMIHVK